MYSLVPIFLILCVKLDVAKRPISKLLQTSTSSCSLQTVFFRFVPWPGVWLENTRTASVAKKIGLKARLGTESIDGETRLRVELTCLSLSHRLAHSLARSATYTTLSFFVSSTSTSSVAEFFNNFVSLLLSQECISSSFLASPVVLECTSMWATWKRPGGAPLRGSRAR